MKTTRIFLSTFMLILAGYSNLSFGQKFTTRDYDKTEVYIKTRDSVALYTAIYKPKDHSKRYPMLFCRSSTGCAPYGKDMPDEIMYNDLLVREGYIFVYQDIRGRAMSDGEDMINMKPVYSQKDPSKTDEVTDAWDSIDWLTKNVKNFNGNVGMFGNSYKGWTALMGSLTHHPALKAVQAGAPCIDIYFEDFNRYGLFALGYTPVLDFFGTRKTKREPGPWWDRNQEYFSFYESWTNKTDKDSYDFFLKKGPLKNYGSLLFDNNYLWQYIKQHPDYDEARQERNALPYLKNINCPVLIVGGWFDEQNMYGCIKSYEAISKNNKASTKYIMGPWTHGDYSHKDSLNYVGNIYFGKNVNAEYMEKEFAFFQHHLNNKPDDGQPAISFFNTGNREWSNYNNLTQTRSREFYLQPNELLSETTPGENEKNTFQEYLSNPAKPVPYIEQDNFNLFVSKSFMTDDQRFASKRPDVLTYSTDALKENITLSGKIDALLKFATDRQDADIIVKVIDVLPMDRLPEPTDKAGLKMNGYQQMVRCGYLRGRYRESFSAPKPFTSNTITDVKVELLDINHTFKKGHRIMVQVQSSLFPLFDRNPQNYVRSIYEADAKDFTKANHRLYSGSKLVFRELMQ